MSLNAKMTAEDVAAAREIGRRLMQEVTIPIPCRALVARGAFGQPVECRRRSAAGLCDEHAGQRWS